jgi:hypothetical protein
MRETGATASVTCERFNIMHFSRKIYCHNKKRGGATYAVGGVVLDIVN